MRTLFFALSIVLAIVISPVLSFGQSSAEEEARTYLVRGAAAIEMAKGDSELAAAVEEFKKATEIAPNLSAAWYNLGAVQAKIGQFKEAIDSYNRYLTLAPQADDARKIKDEVIKLGYRLEQTGKFKSLSGQWITLGGAFARINADGGKLTIIMENSIDFPGSADVWMYDKNLSGPNTYSSRAPAIRLESLGSKLIGVLEIESGSSSGGWCSLPAEKSQVEGTLDKGRILLKMKKMKFRVVMNSNDTLFSSPAVHCDGVTPTGVMAVEMVLMGPLDNGGLNVSYGRTERGTIYVYTDKDSAIGLEKEDEIISVDGTDLAQLKNYGEQIVKLRGQPGTPVQLVVKRTVEKGGFFSKAKEANLNITVQRVPITPVEGRSKL